LGINNAGELKVFFFVVGGGGRERKQWHRFLHLNTRYMHTSATSHPTPYLARPTWVRKVDYGHILPTIGRLLGGKGGVNIFLFSKHTSRGLRRDALDLFFDNGVHT
jgi:hypothetical protein